MTASEGSGLLGNLSRVFKALIVVIVFVGLASTLLWMSLPGPIFGPESEHQKLRPVAVALSGQFDAVKPGATTPEEILRRVADARPMRMRMKREGAFDRIELIAMPGWATMQAADPDALLCTLLRDREDLRGTLFFRVCGFRDDSEKPTAVIDLIADPESCLRMVESESTLQQQDEYLAIVIVEKQ